MTSDPSTQAVPEVALKPDTRVDSAPESVRRVLEGRITGGSLRPGEKIGLKADLQKEFGVAGPTLDTALQLLVSDGLVDIRRGPNGGVFVARSRPLLRLGSSQLWARDARSLGENIELREALTAYVGASAARASDRDPSKLDELMVVAQDLDGAAIGFDTQRLIWRGHRLLADLVDSSTLRTIYVDLLDAAEALILEIDFPQTGAEAKREQTRYGAHASLFRAVVDGDVELARECGEIVRIVSPFGRDPNLLPDQSGQRR